METSGEGSDSSSNSQESRSYGLQFSAANLLQAPITAILEYSGIIRPRSGHPEEDFRDRINGAVSSPRGEEVSIRIIGSSEQDNPQQLVVGPGRENIQNVEAVGVLEGEPLVGDQSNAASGNPPAVEEELGSGANNRDSGYQRYDIQQAAKWFEQILPFSLLLLVVFIRQHLQGMMGSNFEVYLC